eukprot:scaffold313690_cov28-Prasinocladus_malaysianus.AAC.1
MLPLRCKEGSDNMQGFDSVDTSPVDQGYKPTFAPRQRAGRRANTGPSSPTQGAKQASTVRCSVNLRRLKSEFCCQDRV